MKKRRKFFSADVVEPLDALSTNRNRTKVAVTGRTVTKVYAINDDHFELRTERNKPRKTMYFSGSIAWSPLKENLIAAASSNGAIYLWDPEIAQSMECSYKAHKQLATKVCFSEFNENVLVSGSKDSTVWLYDLRMAEPSTCFASNQDDSIRDIQFCMESKMQETFVTAGDSGTIRFWDSRRPDRALKEFIAHSSQVYSIALNPQVQSKNLIATAGRDKFIRIWDWSMSTPDFLYTVEMMAIVTRVSWSPDNSWHVSCCFAPPSGFVSSDNTIYVWDIRRPFIPFAAFDAHTKTCTDMSWPRFGAGNSFLSCGKDGRLIMNFTEGAHRPIIYANSVALDMNTGCNDEIIVAVPTFRRKSSSTLVDSASDPFRRNVPSTLFSAQPTDPMLMDGRTLSYFGQNYKLFGASIDELCEHNGRVADSIFKNRVAHTWRTVALLCAQSGELGSQNARTATQFVPLNSLTNLPFPRCGDASKLNLRSQLGNGANAMGSCAKETSADRANAGGGGGGGSSSAAVLISGSLTAHQNAHVANTDLFFGSDELNLGGMDGDSEREMRTSSRRSIVSSSIIINLAQLKEEAFELNRRTHTSGGRHLLHSSAAATDRRSAAGQKQQQRPIGERRRRQPSYGGGGGGGLDSSIFGTSAEEDKFIAAGRGGEGETAIEEEEQQRQQSPSAAEEEETTQRVRTAAAVIGAAESSSTTNSSSGIEDDLETAEEEEDEGGEEVADGGFSGMAIIPPSEAAGKRGAGGDHGGRHYDLLLMNPAAECCYVSAFADSGGGNQEPSSMVGTGQPHQQQGSAALLQQFDPLPTLKALLDFYSDQGDVQMCASMCCVIGERLLVDCKLVSAAQVELWMLSYIEILERLKLWRVAALLIKFCYRPKISQLSNESTFVKVYCRNCRSTAARGAQMRCTKCRQLYNYSCIICEITVRGIWSSCAECGHGGHLAHMLQWFSQSQVCPAIGCGHRCDNGKAATLAIQ